jgi:hypothetical protein
MATEENKIPIKLLVGNEESENLKAQEKGRLLFAETDSALNNKSTVFKIYYDEGSKLIPIAAKESDYALYDSEGNQIKVSTYATKDDANNIISLIKDPENADAMSVPNQIAALEEKINNIKLVEFYYWEPTD